ncbi:MAG: autotransporter domain-containing protein [Methylococcaceae bacterium]
MECPMSLKIRLSLLVILAWIFLLLPVAVADTESYSQSIVNALAHADAPMTWLATDLFNVSEAGSVGANANGLQYYGAAANNQLIVRTASTSSPYNGGFGGPVITAGSDYAIFGGKSSFGSWVTLGNGMTNFIVKEGLTGSTVTKGIERGLGMDTKGTHDTIFEMAVTVGDTGNNPYLLRPVRNPNPAAFSTTPGDYGTSGAIPATAALAGIGTGAAADSVYTNYKAAYTAWAGQAYTTNPFPWTQLGYTYYWGQTANPPTLLSQVQGMSEFTLLGGTGSSDPTKTPSGTNEAGQVKVVGIYATESYIYTKNKGGILSSDADAQYGNGFASFKVTGSANTLWAGANFQTGAKLDAGTPNTITVDSGGSISGGQGILVGSQNYTVNNAGTITAKADTKKFNITGSENIALLFKGDTAAYVGAVKNILYNSGSITGPGTNGTAVKVLAGNTDITNTGTITGSGSGSGYAVQTGTGNDTVTVNGGSVTGKIDLGTGTDALAVNMGGTLVGKITTIGSVTVNGGTLRVGDGSTFGTGEIKNNATLDIGSTTLAIGGTYTQSAASTLMVAVNGATNGSLVATGTATATAGYNLALNVSNYIQNNATYKIIQGAAVGSAIAAPAISVLGNHHVTFAATTFSSDALIVTASRVANAFANDANPGDANARNVGNTLDTMTNPSADMSTVLNAMDGLSKSQSAAALDTMVPEVDAGVLNNDRATLNNFTQLSTDRVEKAHKEKQSKHSARSGVSSGEADKLDGLWAKGYGSYLTQGTRGGIAGYNAWNAGTALGVDRRFTDALTLGISGGYAYGNVNSDANSANTTINSAQTTLYGGYQDQKRPFFIDTAVSFAYNWYAGRRNINVGNVILRTANGSYSGQQYGAYLGVGYRFKFADAIEVTPLVSLQYNNLQINSYNETGAGALNVNTGTQNYNQLQSGLGGRIATTLSSQWGKVTPELHSKWLYDFFGDPFAVTSNFNGGGAAFGSNGAKPAVNSFNVGGELKLDLRDEIALIGKVDTQLRQGFSGVFGSFTVRF